MQAASKEEKLRAPPKEEKFYTVDHSITMETQINVVKLEQRSTHFSNQTILWKRHAFWKNVLLSDWTWEKMSVLEGSERQIHTCIITEQWSNY